MSREKNSQFFLHVIIVIAGQLIYALSVKLFLFPLDFVVAGSTGVALIVNHFFKINVSLFILIFNIVMLFLGFLIIGKEFALTTLVSTFAYPIALALWEQILNDIIITDNMLLSAIFAGIGLGVSLGIILRCGASTGGMDIPPMIIKQFFGIPISIAMYFFDVLIIIGQAVYHLPEDILYGILLVIVYTVVLDQVLIVGRAKTQITVVSQKSEEIRQCILLNIDRGVTILQGEGGYLRNQEQIVFSVVSNREVPKVQKLIQSIDPDSFIVITRVSEVKGHGFSMKKQYQKNALRDGTGETTNLPIS